MYYIGICDDEKNICEELAEMLAKIMAEFHEDFKLTTWFSGEELCHFLEAGNHCDLLFLDIEFQGINGVDAGQYIRNGLENRKTSIIYISYHKGYAMQLFKLQPLDFLVKPLDYDEVKGAVGVFLKISKRMQAFLEYQIGHKHYKQACDEILYLYSDDKKIRLVMHHEQKEFYGKLKEIYSKLPSHFVQIHKSFVVNQDYVMQYSYEQVKMMDGQLLNVSRTYRNSVREKMLQDKKEREYES